MARASNMAPVMTVTAAPSASAATTTRATAAYHVVIDLDRVMRIGMLFTWRRASARRDLARIPQAAKTRVDTGQSLLSVTRWIAGTSQWRRPT
jgi:hypothetical protein